MVVLDHTNPLGSLNCPMSSSSAPNSDPRSFWGVCDEGTSLIGSVMLKSSHSPPKPPLRVEDSEGSNVPMQGGDWL